MKKINVKGFFKKLEVLLLISFIAGILVTSLLDDNLKSGDEDKIKKQKIYKKVSPDDINIALDSYNNLIIIDNKTGQYTIYQDSIGQTIFELYSNQIWIKNKK